MRMAIIHTVATTPSEMPTGWSGYALDVLRQVGLRNGGARRSVVEHLGAQQCCRSAQEIFDGIRAGGARVGIASVYRVLDQLVELRLAQRVDVGDGITRFEPAHADGHHHHLVCDDCGKVEPFSDAGLERALERVAGRLGYAIDAHEVVLHGACGTCR
ncbi:Fe2+/Zn2+ uptake regulation protein [Gaiella occulta]|uniref:Fe2+/Zn2+ uptake regulation protein n=1 Tax=Gaiella occulta TaxID=1002870 RepID=A0A7M2YXK2_9ACTN|nr:Fe2+/Zn2+ uptake regulation protein [Gaiella occulta]